MLLQVNSVKANFSILGASLQVHHRRQHVYNYKQGFQDFSCSRFEIYLSERWDF